MLSRFGVLGWPHSTYSGSSRTSAVGHVEVPFISCARAWSSELGASAIPQVLAHGLVMTLASRYGRTPAQILFRYLTQADVVPLTGMTSAAHMREDLAIFDFELAETEPCSARAVPRSWRGSRPMS